jgi:hypothetical protein
MDWSIEAVEKNLLSGKIEILDFDPKVVVAALNRVEKMLGGEWIKSQTSAKGVMPTMRLVTFRACHQSERIYLLSQAEVGKTSTQAISFITHENVLGFNIAMYYWWGLAVRDRESTADLLDKVHRNLYWEELDAIRPPESL